MTGFDLTETGTDRWRDLWLRGGFPRSYLAASDSASFGWREQFVRTFLTLDMPQLGIAIPAPQMRRFWIMMAHYHAQTWNSSEIKGSLGISDKTARHYLDILTGAFMVRQLPMDRKCGQTPAAQSLSARQRNFSQPDGHSFVGGAGGASETGRIVGRFRPRANAAGVESADRRGVLLGGA
jgi:hypothetical protein